MARSYAQVHQRIWADPEWRSLDADAQLLYLLLLSQPSMNFAGVLPLQLRKWAACVSGWDPPTVDMALSRLADARFVVVDADTEEVLVRSFIRNDGGFKTPGVLKSALKFAEAAQSPAIRAALYVELGRLPELEGKTAAEGEALIAATRAHLEPIGDPFPDPIRNGFRKNPSANPSMEPIADPIGDPSVSVSGSVPKVPHPQNSENSSRGGSHVSSGPPEQPPLYPDRCKAHGDVADPGPCGGCADVRKANAVRPRLSLVGPSMPAHKPHCGNCDETRHLETPVGVIRCPECHPRAEEAS
jgi:hypothetical protein